MAAKATSIRPAMGDRKRAAKGHPDSATLCTLWVVKEERVMAVGPNTSSFTAPGVPFPDPPQQVLVE